MDDRIFIATIQKNRSSEIRVSLEKYKGVNLVDVRIFEALDGGDRRPTKRGISLVVTRIPALADAIQLALEEARRLGMFEDRSQAA